MPSESERVTIRIPPDKVKALHQLVKSGDYTTISDAIRGVDLKPGDSDMAIKEMRVHGARFSESRGLARLLRRG